MNICFFTIQHISRGRGGLENIVAYLSESLTSIGHRIFLVSAHNALENDTILNNQYILPCKEVNDAENQKYLTHFFNRNIIDIIVIHSNEICCLDLIVSANKNKIPIISVIHTDPAAATKTVQDNWNYWKLQYGPTKFILSYPLLFIRKLYQIHTRKKYTKTKHLYYYNQSSAVVLLSEKFFYSFKKLSGITDTRKLFAISNPRTIKVQEYKLDEKENIVLFVGRLVFQKRLDRLFKIWNRIKDKKDWKLVIIGDGPDRSFYETLCRKWNVENVEFIGQCNPEPFYKKAKILCMTSSYEGNPCVIQEALQNCIIPIAFESFESITDTIINNKNGFLIKPFSIKQYTICLKELINNQEKLRRFQRYIESSNQEEHGYNCKILESWENLITVICAKNETSN